MEMTPRKYSNKKSAKNVDEWLKSEGYFKKSSPKDPTCLFRAVSENIYKTQYYHIRVRKECVEFMRQNKFLFEKNIMAPIDDYLEQLSCFTEWGGNNEIEAMAILYKRDFIVFNTAKMTKQFVTDNDYEDCIHLSYTPPKHYECLFEKRKIATAGFCQSVVYKLLYENVFQMSNINQVVEGMLHESIEDSGQFHNKFMLKDKDRHSDTRKKFIDFNPKKSNDDDNTSEKCKAVIPFPYRVAKALDPNIYRNIDFDIWQEMKREARNSGWIKWNNYELQVGGKCLVQVNYREDDVSSTSSSISNNNRYNNNSSYININIKKNNYTKDTSFDSNGNISKACKPLCPKKESVLLVGHIQEMSQNEGPVVVFIEELGEKKTVPYSALKPLQDPRRGITLSTTTPNVSQKKITYDPNTKWRKPSNSNAGKPRSLMINYKNTPALTAHIDINTENDNNDNYHHINNANINTNKNDSLESANVEQNMLISTNSSDNAEAKKIDPVIIEREMTMKNYYPRLEYSSNSPNPLKPHDQVVAIPENAEIINSKYHTNENYGVKSFTPNTRNNPIKFSDKNNSGKNNIVDGNGNHIQPNEIAVAVANDNFCPSNSACVPPFYPGNLNIVCVSPEGNVYAPFFYVGNHLMGPPVAGILNCNNQPINYNAQISVETNGNDLPYSDIPTLKFFYNLGVEYFRCNHMWSGQSMPMTHMPNDDNIMPMQVSCHVNSPSIPAVPPPTENNQQQLTHDKDINVDVNRNHQNINNNQPFIRRKNERTYTNRVNPKLNLNTKNVDTRKFEQDYRQEPNKHKNERYNGSFEYQKSRYSHNNENKDLSNVSWDVRKNRGQYKKLTEDRPRFDRFQYEQHKKINSSGNHYMNQNNINMNNNVSANNIKCNENNAFNLNNNFDKNVDQKSINNSRTFEHQHTQGNPNQVPEQQASASSVATSSASLNQPPAFNQQSQPVFTGVPYYPNEMENMYPVPGNIYPISYLPHTESNESNNQASYCCNGLDNYPPPLTPVYSPVPFSSSSILPSPSQPPPGMQPVFPTVVPPNTPENWFFSGQPHFIPYTQHFSAPPPPPPPLQPQQHQLQNNTSS